MAKVALRVYTREIEELIDSGQIKESVAHARHILESFPKYVDAYRLLGKAYLEEQQYGDAADIFQRLLSSKPDDFISQVGMSIIREDEGNLDASIWHMERAFEVQSSNQAIQDELRRLYGRRDGLQPPKVRLTRGALARMYAHGELYDQAIAEIKAALADDSQRPDLQVLLALTYYNAGKVAEAAEACKRILEKLPHCLEANHLIASIYRESNREKEAQQYLQLVGALDPYLAQTNVGMSSAEDVPDKAVTIEHLDWKPGMSDDLDEQPAWASKLGVSLIDGEDGRESTPDWLSNPKGEDEQFKSQINGEPVNDADNDKSQEELPEWMSTFSSEDDSAEDSPEPVEEQAPDWLSSESGDNKSSEESAEPPVEELPDFLSDTSNGDSSAEDSPEPLEEQVPDWMSADASDGDTSQGQIESSSEELPDFIGDLSSPDSGLDTPETAGEEIPDWMDGIADGDTSVGRADEPAPQAEPGSIATSPAEDNLPEKTSSDAQEDVPEFLKDAGWEEGSPEEAPVENILDDTSDEDTELAPAEIPDWMQELQPEGFEASEQAVDLPSEISPPTPVDAEPETIDVADTLSASGGDPIDDMSWMQDIDDITGNETTAPKQDAGIIPGADATSNGDGDDDSMAWLEGLAAKQGAPEEELLTQPADRPEESPATQEGVDHVKVEDHKPAAGTASDTLPVPTAESEDDSMSWLEGLAAKQGAPEEELLTQPEDRTEESPEWLKGLEQEQSPVEETEDHKPPEPESETPTTPENEDESMDWLEGLAEKQGVAEEELLTQPEDRTEESPEWLKGLEQDQSPVKDAKDQKTPAGTVSDTVPIPPPESGVLPVSDENNEDDSMSWLEGLAAKQGAAEEELLTKPEDRTEESPSWLQGLTQESPATEGQKVPAVPSGDTLTMPAAKNEDDSTSLMEGLTGEQDTAMDEIPTPPEEQAGEIKSSGDESATAESQEISGIEDKLSWLDDIAEQNAEEKSQSAEDSANQIDRKEDMLSWLDDMDVPDVDSESSNEESPDWMQSIGADSLDIDVEVSQVVSADEPTASLPQESVDLPSVPSQEDTVTSPSETDSPQMPADSELQSAEPVEAPLSFLEAEDVPPADPPDLQPNELLPEEPVDVAPTETPPPPVTEPPAAEPPAAESPAVEPLTDEPPASESPAVEPITEQPPAAELPAAESPVVEPLMDEPPVAESPVVEPLTDEIPAAEPPAPKPRKKAKKKKKKAVSKADKLAQLTEAREIENAGDLDEALTIYGSLIKNNHNLEEIMEDLQGLLSKHPISIPILQTLGDAYMRADRLQEALDSYSKAEELLR